MSYVITLEKFTDTYLELEPLYRQHYSEMIERLNKEDFEYSSYNPRLDEYGKACENGSLLTFVLRLEGVACGYINVYITNDMHNQDLIAQEDALYVLKNHRSGIGKKLVQFGIDDLRNRKVKRLNVNAMTDLRVAKLWERMGFKHTCHNMTYSF